MDKVLGPHHGVLRTIEGPDLLSTECVWVYLDGEKKEVQPTSKTELSKMNMVLLNSFEMKLPKSPR